MSRCWHQLKHVRRRGLRLHILYNLHHWRLVRNNGLLLWHPVRLQLIFVQLIFAVDGICATARYGPQPSKEVDSVLYVHRDAMGRRG